MGVDSTGYKILLVLHILSVVIGFGGLFFQGLMVRRARLRPGPEAWALLEASQEVSFAWALWFVLAVPLLGIGLVFSSNKMWSFSQAWVGAGLLLWVIAAGIVVGVLRPTLARAQAVLSQRAGGGGGPRTGSGTSEADGLLARAEALVGTVDVIVVIVVVLMVLKPGT